MITYAPVECPRWGEGQLDDPVGHEELRGRGRVGPVLEVGEGVVAGGPVVRDDQAVPALVDQRVLQHLVPRDDFLPGVVVAVHEDEDVALGAEDVVGEAVGDVAQLAQPDVGVLDLVVERRPGVARHFQVGGLADVAAEYLSLLVAGRKNVVPALARVVAGHLPLPGSFGQGQRTPGAPGRAIG